MNTKIMFSKIASALTIFMMVFSLVGFTPAKAGAVGGPVRLFSASTSPATVIAGANQSFTVTFTNDPTSTDNINSARLSLPAGFTLQNSPTPTLGSVTNWDVCVSAPDIQMGQSNGGGATDVPPGSSFTVTFSAIAPLTGGSYTVAARAFKNQSCNPGGGAEFEGNLTPIVVDVKYTLTTTSSGNGTVGPSGSYNTGTVVPLTNTPDSGYHFVNWTGDADCSDGSVTMNAHTSCTANFEADSINPVNQPPVANAGIDASITLPTASVNLDGSASTDSDGTIVSYDWSVVSGPSTPTITDVVNPSVGGLVAGTYVFGLTVTDDDSAISSQDTVSITVNPIPVFECSDNIDNDSDGYTDFPLDPGCDSLTDNSELPINVDACPNETTDPGFQNSVPCNSDDICTNIIGIQTTLPDNHGYASAGICVPDQCPNDIGIQTSTTQCTPDACTNIAEFQATVPDGMEANNGICTFIDVCPNDEGNQTNVDQCTPQTCSDEAFTATFVSDATTMVGVNPSALLTNINAGWTAVISGASWIWSTDPVVLVADPATETETFTKTFNVDKVNNTISGASLMISVDNSYSVTLNGNPLCSDSDLDNVPPLNYSAAGQDVCPILAGDLLNGSNTLSITVTNEAHGNSAASNPAGLLYKLTVNGNTCDVPPPPIDMCLNLEGNQNSIPNGYDMVGEGQCLPTECYDDVDNNDEEDSLADELDPGCWIDPNNPETYDPNDESETRVDACPNDERFQTNSEQCNVPDDEPEDNGGGGSSSGSRVNRGQVLGAATDVCNWNTQYARKSWKGNIPGEVETIQNFLNLHMNAGLAVDKIYGPKTEAAVNAFQDKYAIDILTPWGISKHTGIWYISTTTKAKELMCGEKVALPALINWSKNPAVVR